MKWRVEQADIESVEARAYLDAGWEPFAAVVVRRRTEYSEWDHVVILFRWCES